MFHPRDDPELQVTLRKQVTPPAPPQAPCILFIDEFDGLGKARTAAGNDESVHTINQLLTGAWGGSCRGHAAGGAAVLQGSNHSFFPGLVPTRLFMRDSLVPCLCFRNASACVLWDKFA